MPDTSTPNYNMIKPEISGSPDTWGNKLNANLDVVDTNMKRVDTRSFAAVPKDGSENVTALLKYESTVVPPSDDFHLASKKYVDDTIKLRLLQVMPIGTVIMFSGALADIPTDWGLCNGQVQEGKLKPNMLDRFVVGAGSTYAVQAVGGANDHNHSGVAGATILTEAQMPAHVHGVNDPTHVHGGTVASHSHTVPAGGTTYAGPGSTNPSVAGSSIVTGAAQPGVSIGGNATGVYLGYAGSSTSHTHTIALASNMPLYYALFFIVRVK